MIKRSSDAVFVGVPTGTYPASSLRWTCHDPCCCAQLLTRLLLPR